jgi:DNA-binding CsgD family transcriptional regulator
MNATDKSMKLRDKLLNDREKLVVRLREEEKLTCQEIGVRLGMSPSMVSHIHITARRKLRDFAENGEDALSLLPRRVRRLVIILQIGNRARARAAMESGRLSWHKGLVAIIWDGVMLREVSRRTWAALYEWAGRPAMPPFRREAWH